MPVLLGAPWSAKGAARQTTSISKIDVILCGYIVPDVVLFKFKNELSNTRETIYCITVHICTFPFGHVWTLLPALV